ncbi:MAG: sigma 54-interacting transcriptional regulator [Acidobacteriota bacterium]|nr:sigma 54-interacting transcriptional regulator [Acidobacteriota bacterium]MDE3043265.1 sigma 54-interacting transcriptional regulator [Acidobacteriota bacterium]MDE3107569.1 sigma 54-interacting transcriptional regulator [Acidobacteriota bacterium]MDE3222310.1 sigma 54-interacting transcriptional regulator [Acidobacteriota bacterium]
MSTPEAPAHLPRTLGALRASGYESRSVRDELRRNLEARLASGQPLSSAVLGYEDTVLPQLETALLAGHDVILLGERGQAKTRMIRSLVELLDEWLPIVEGSDVRDDPYAPISAYGIDTVRERGDDTPIAWVHRQQRFAEKLASPDTSMADLIGEVDPIKVAGGLFLDDPKALSYGLVPKSNRGIFAINELPDLAERIQVGLLNVLEERDVQIRGHLVRLELDVLVVATANPEDYTNRGRLITPLKDRFGSQIRTHYPFEVTTEIAIMHQEAHLPPSTKEIRVPWFIDDVVARVSHVARKSHVISQRSGVSVRLSIANYETVIASALRRTLRTGDAAVVPRVSDLSAIVQSTQGKIEFDTMDDNDADQVIAALVGLAVRQCFSEHVLLEEAPDIVNAFNAEVVVHTGDDLPDADYLAVLTAMPALEAPVRRVAGPHATDGEMASAAEFVLEGLYLTKRLAKDASGARALYRSRNR